MSSKAAIIGALGEDSLLLPQQIERALTANSQIKVLLTAFQAAQRHADTPDQPPLDLAAERQAAGLGKDVEAAVSNSRRQPDGTLLVPGAGKFRDVILDGLAAMLAPLKLARVPQAVEWTTRLATLTAALAPLEADRVPDGLIAAMTSVEPVGGGHAENVHRLTMDLHKALNALQADLAQESIDGASVWHIATEDRGLISAFMAGVNDTSGLKFQHPGLGTTATRVAGSLLIQNDIGATSAHVLVLHVDGLLATLTCTDVHRQRLEFLKRLLKAFQVDWRDVSPRHDEQIGSATLYWLTTGRYQAPDPHSLSRYLTFLGSRIVFLIDWNRARKQLRGALPKADVLRLLDWAAGEKIGHRGFLQLGGARLLSEAIDFAQPPPLHHGASLHELLGVQSAYEYLKFVLRQATSGLLAGRDERFIHDEIRAELARRVRSLHAGLMSLALDHAARVFDLASDVHDGLLACDEPGPEPLLERTARRARSWERECDAIVRRIRSLASRTSSPELYTEVLHCADQAADGLEEAAFLMTHVPKLGHDDSPVNALAALAALLVAGAQESLKMFEAASHVTRAGACEDLQDFFAAVDRVVSIEREADDAERGVTSALLENRADARTYYLIGSLSRALENAADGLALSALKLRDQLLEQIRMA